MEPLFWCGAVCAGEFGFLGGFGAGLDFVGEELESLKVEEVRAPAERDQRVGAEAGEAGEARQWRMEGEKGV